jgi:hypothetical protein
MKVHKNTFQKGMIKDVSDFMKPSDSYCHALDIRLNSEGAENEYTVTNIKGTEFLISIPEVSNIVTIEPSFNGTPFPLTFSPQVNVNGTLYTGSPITSTDYDDLFNNIETSLRTDAVFTPLNLNIARSGQRITIWSSTSEVTFFLGTSYVNVTLQQKQFNHLVIGWGLINDDIYLFTTNNSTQQGGVGAWWKLTYNPVTFSPAITLIYTADLSVSTERPIVNPGGIETMYENDDTARIYWTDRYNPLSSINVFDSNIMAVSPDRLHIDSGITLKKLTLNNVSTGGALISGMYTMSYRLRSGENTITGFAPESGNIHIVEADGSGSFQNYEGNLAGTITNKKITVNFSGIDTSYQFVDIIVLRKESADARPFIAKIAEIPVSGTDFTYTYTGNEEESFITEDEYTKINQIFNVCHTIAQKDNYLFAANTEGEDFDIEFDARAYRFDANGRTQLFKADGTTIEYDGIAWQDANDLANISFHIPETNDSYLPNQSTHMYQQDGTTTGGQGPNVRYTFTTRPVGGDVLGVSGVGITSSPDNLPYPWRLTWREFNDTNIDLGDGNLYTQRNNAHPGFGSEYNNHYLRGYRREETYRYSIVFVKNGIESYAKWIADIKMPAVHQERNGYGVWEDYPLMSRVFTGNELDDRWWINTLGVKFQVDVSSIIDQIDGFRIKRVKVTPEDRTVLGQGILHMSEQNLSNLNSYHPYARVSGTSNNDGANASSYSLSGSNTVNFAPVFRHWPVMSLVSPDFLFGKGIDHRTGDQIKVVTGLSPYNNATASSKRLSGEYDISSPPGTVPANTNEIGGQVGLFKLYRHVNVKRNFWTSPYTETGKNVQDAKNVTQGATVIVDNKEFSNIRKNANMDESHIFSDAVALAVNDFEYLPLSLSSTDVEGVITPFGTYDDNFASKLLVNYIRPNSGQYGGRSFVARSNNTYINTNIDVVINKSSNITSYTLDTFGGDTFINIFDNYRSIRNLNKYQGNSGTDGAHRIFGTVLMFPVESYVNTDIRHGVTPLKNSNWSLPSNPPNPPDPDLHPIVYGEDFKYDYTWSSEPDTDRSFSRPFNVDINLVHPARIWASAKKILGERVDSFMRFRTESFIDITGKFGEIRQLINNNDKLHAFQKRAFGIASVNERSVINDQEGNGIILGEAGVLPRFDYVSQHVGSYHQSSFSSSPRGILFYNVLDSGIYMYTGEGLTDITDQRIKQWLYDNTRGDIQNNDIPFRGNVPRIGMSATYDNRNKEFLITFMDAGHNSFTVAYADTKNTIVSYRTPKPSMYINDNVNIIAPLPEDDRSLHIMDKGIRGSFFNNPPVPSELDITLNPYVDIPKVIDNFSWMSLVTDASGNEINLDTISSLELTNSQQTTGIRTTFTRRLREWWHKVTYAQGTKDRMRSHYFKLKMRFNNSDDRKIILNNLLSYYRLFQK